MGGPGSGQRAAAPARARSLGWPTRMLAVAALAGLTAGCGSSGQPPATAAASSSPAATASGPAVPASSGATPPPGAAAGGTPDAVVMEYFDAVSHQDWPRAWQLGGQHLSSSYRSMIRGFAQTAHVDVTITATRGSTVQVLLVAEQTDGSTQTYHAAYQVISGVIRRGRAARHSTGSPQPAVYSVLAGVWTGHGRDLTVTAGGLGIASYRVYHVCSSQQAPPCDSMSGDTLYPGGVTVFQLTSHTGDRYRGAVLDASFPPASGPVTVTLNPSAGSLTVAAGKQGPIFYCSPRAKPGTCGA